MKKPIATREFIERFLRVSKFAVLATEGDGQPHMSLIAVTPSGGYREIIFATYRSTHKYRNLKHNSKVAVLIGVGNLNNRSDHQSSVLTAVGRAEEVSSGENDMILITHLERHPDLEYFLRSPDCALIRVIVQSFQVVHGIDDARWFSVDELDAT